jgi:hypothetical protein
MPKATQQHRISKNTSNYNNNLTFSGGRSMPKFPRERIIPSGGTGYPEIMIC